MISTVTTSTVTTITSVVGMVNTFALVAVLLFTALLITREIISVNSQDRAARAGRSMNIGLIPLGIAFMFIAVVRLQTPLN